MVFDWIDNLTRDAGMGVLMQDPRRRKTPST
jgi:hypothetical protein